MLDSLFAHPRRVFGTIALICAGMLAFGILYLQNVVGLEPCPMCIVQRYALIIVGVFAALAAFSKGPAGWRLWGILGALLGGYLFGSLGGAVGGGLLGSIVVATLGAIILIAILRLIKRA